MSGQVERRGSRPAKRESEPTGVTVGSHVDATCGKCKAATSHIVLAKIGSKPTRVECRTCGATHAFRSPPSARAETAAARRKREPAASPEEVWTASMRRAVGEAVPYDSTAWYSVGNRLSHSRFGEGVVTRLSSATTCEVVFASGTIKLVMGGPAGSRVPAYEPPDRSQRSGRSSKRR